MDITQVEVAGPCRITYKGVDLGHTLDGVEFSYEREFEDVVVDKYGSMAIDKVLTGSKATIKVKLAQNNIRNLDTAVPESSTVDASNDRADLGVDAGATLRGESGQLVIHPLKNATGDQSDDITLYKAVSVETLELNYKIDEQVVVEVTFEALVDESYSSGRRLGHIGYAAVS